MNQQLRDDAAKTKAISYFDPSQGTSEDHLQQLFTVGEASAHLSVARSWLYERTRKNAIPHHRFGKYIRFTKSDLERIIAAGSIG
jgi:excisionase family DNA binding protein